MDLSSLMDVEYLAKLLGKGHEFAKASRTYEWIHFPTQQIDVEGLCFLFSQKMKRQGKVWDTQEVKNKNWEEAMNIFNAMYRDP